MRELYDFFTERTDAIVTLLEKLVRHESPSHDKPLVDQFGAFIHEQVIALGGEVEVFPREAVGDIRLAKWNAAAPGKPILLMMHLDTVWPAGTLDNTVPVKLENGRFHGPGALDMKAGIAVALETLRGLQERGHFPQRPIWLLFTTDEETGSHHSREIIIETAKGCGLCLVMEPAADNEGLKTARKGTADYTVTAYGVASHAGHAPEAGVNAIIELAQQALVLQNLNDLRRGTSVSVTQIQGGTASNVIPAQASLNVDVRFFLEEEARRVDKVIQTLYPAMFGSRVEVVGGINRPPLEHNALMIKTYEQAKGIAERLGFVLGQDSVGGASDGNLVAPLGIPILDGLGGHGDGMHALHEHVLVRSLGRRAALLAGILEWWVFED